jgi:isopentenyldiphosphate isomerase
MINSKELLFVVDEFDVPLEPRPRHETLKKGYWHRTAHVWVMNDLRQILCQKRSMLKDMAPGKWEPAVTGHIGPGDDYFTGAIKEVREETGLPLTREDLNLIKIYKDYEMREFRGIFTVNWNGSIDEVISEKEEVDAVKWVSITTLKNYLLYQKSAPWVKPGYEKEMLSILTQG